MVWGKQALARKTSGAYYYYLYNGHGDVVQIIDQNGNIVNSYTYDEWGNILSRQEQLPQPLKYAGEYYDEESGLYYLRARYYDPAVGRFISRDSYEGSITNPLSLNPYTYVENNPLGNIDPSGHFSIGAIIGGAVIKAVVKVVVKAVTSSSSSNKSGGSGSKSSSSGGSSSSSSGGSSSGSGGGSSGIISSIGSAAASLIGGFVDLVGGRLSDQFSKGSSKSSNFILLACAGGYYDIDFDPEISDPSLRMAGKREGEYLPDKIAKERNLNRKLWGKYIHEEKYRDGRGGSDNYSKDELNDMADTFEQLYGKKAHYIVPIPALVPGEVPAVAPAAPIFIIPGGIFDLFEELLHPGEMT